MTAGNLFAIAGKMHPSEKGEEQVEVLSTGDCRIERIVSFGQTSPAGFWYAQEQDEWVALLQGKARLQWDDASETEMGPGDWLLIKNHRRHRVTWTSTEPPCIWLAMHGKLNESS